MGDPTRLISQVKLKVIPLTFKGIFPEMSNSVSPPAEPGVYLNENYNTHLKPQNKAQANQPKL